MPTRTFITESLGPLQRLRHVSFSRQRFSVLFFFLLFSLLVYPYAETSTVGYYAFRLTGSAVIILTVYALAVRRGLLLLLLVLSVPTLLRHILLSPSASGTPALVGRLLSLSFDLVVIAIVARCVFTDEQPSSETIFGALCIYLLIGYAFAGIYGLILSTQPVAFFLDPAVNRHTFPDRFDLIYFSFGTMTELGTPGITAVSREVRSVSLLEAVLGILYLAVLISRLMSAYRPVSIMVERSAPGELPVAASGSAKTRVPAP